MPYGLGRVGRRGKGSVIFFYICRMINSPMNLLVMRKPQLWANPDLSVSMVGWLPGAGNHLLLYSQASREGNNDKQK